MKIIVDTNIWIDFLLGKPHAQGIQDLAPKFQILRHIWIEAELRAGNLKKQNHFLEYFKALPEAKLIPFDILFQFIEKEKLSAKGYSFVDIGIYAAAQMGGYYVWTNDKNLKSLCKSKNRLYNREI